MKRQRDKKQVGLAGNEQEPKEHITNDGDTLRDNEGFFLANSFGDGCHQWND